MLLKLIRKYPQIKVSFSISGGTFDQLEAYAPEVLASFRSLAETGSVDFLAETYYHSLASSIPGNEFELQVAKHQKQLHHHLGVSPRVFRNTELIYNDHLGNRISQLGFKGVIIDGVDRVLQSHSPHHVFQHPGSALRILPRNYHLSDDISFRFSNSDRPLTVERYLSWLNAIPQGENNVTLAMDYETFGEHQKKETGIFDFMKKLLSTLARAKNYQFMTASEAAAESTHATLSVPHFISWADEERDLSAWLGNEMQRDAFDSLLKLETDIKNLHDKSLLDTWRSLQTSDHFYYMSTKKGSDGEVHSYFSPYPSPYEAFINYMNVLTDLALRIKVLKAGDIMRPGVTVPMPEEIKLGV